MQPEVLARDRRVRPRTPLDLGLSRSLFVRTSWSQRDVVASQARLAGVAHFLANCGPTHGFALFVSHPLKQDVKVEGTRKQTNRH